MNKKRSAFSISGAIIFFVVIALVIQVAVLVYDYIIQRTTNKGLIAVLILIVIFILSTICTIVDIIRRKYMVHKPVSKILSATKRIAEGDFTTRLIPDHLPEKYNEYDVIMENLNIMALELSKSEILKTDFISNVSHEIKTPLAVIQSYASLLQEDNLTKEERQKYALSLLQATKRLNGLITNILKLNKLENQEIKPEFTVFNLTEQLSEIVISFEELIDKKELELECSFEEIKVNSCASYLEIVWNNLISNAIKFTNQGGKIQISISKSENDAIVSISDTGCGIDSETGKRIFEKFYQGDTSHQGQGNGLGLALVKKVIDILGAQITVDSEKGKGSTFTIVLKNAIK